MPPPHPPPPLFPPLLPSPLPSFSNPHSPSIPPAILTVPPSTSFLLNLSYTLQLECCGYNSSADWTGTIFFNESDGHFPMSCECNVNDCTRCALFGGACNVSTLKSQDISMQFIWTRVKVLCICIQLYYCSVQLYTYVLE